MKKFSAILLTTILAANIANAKDGFYVGCTDNLKDRLTRHRKRHVPATANRLPVELDFYFATKDKYKAFEFEKYLKSGSGRAFIGKHLS